MSFETYSSDESAAAWANVHTMLVMQKDVVSGDDRRFEAPSYHTIIETFGETAEHFEEDSYQGDTFALLKRTAPLRVWGLLNFGWGSCSGCDALQGCDNVEDLKKLWCGLYTSIEWRSNVEMRSYLREHDFSVDWSWRSETHRGFVRALMKRFDVTEDQMITKWDDP